MSDGIYFEITGAGTVERNSNQTGSFPEVLGPFDLAPTSISAAELKIEWGPASTWAVREKAASIPRSALKDHATAKLAAALPERISIVLSPLHPVNLTPGQAAGAAIPPASKHFTWAYPADLSNVPPSALDVADHADVAFLSIGAFIYFDDNMRPLQINSLVKRGSGSLSFGPPKPWTTGWTEWLEGKGKTFHSITLQPLLDTGFTHFTWLPPHTIVGGSLSEGGAHICPHGGYAYVKRFQPPSRVEREAAPAAAPAPSASAAPAAPAAPTPAISPVAPSAPRTPKRDRLQDSIAERLDAALRSGELADAITQVALLKQQGAAAPTTKPRPKFVD